MADDQKALSALDAILVEFQDAYAKHGSAPVRLVVHEYQDDSDRGIAVDPICKALHWFGRCITGAGGGETEHGRYVTTILSSGAQHPEYPAVKAFQSLANKAGAWAAVNLDLRPKPLGCPQEIWELLIHRELRDAVSGPHVGTDWLYPPFSASIETLRRIRANAIAQARQQIVAGDEGRTQRLADAYLKQLLEVQTAEEVPLPEEIELREWFSTNLVEGKFVPFWHSKIAAAKSLHPGSTSIRGVLDSLPLWDMLAALLDQVFSGTCNTYNMYDRRPHVTSNVLYPYLNERHGLSTDDANKLTVRRLAELLAQDADAEHGPRPHAETRAVVRDPSIEARDKWLYDQCRKLVTYETIIRRLVKKPQTWLRITTVQGIKKAATAYAERQIPKLPPIPKRARGRIARK